MDAGRLPARTCRPPGSRSASRRRRRQAGTTGREPYSHRSGKRRAARRRPASRSSSSSTAELRHVRLSDAALAMLGLPAEALVGRTPAETGLPAEVVAPARARAARRARHGRGAPPRAGDADDRRAALAVPAAGARRARARVRLAASDITARKHAELRLTGGHAAFRALVEDSPDPVARVDADLRIGFVNAAFERAVGPAGGGLPRAGPSATPACPPTWRERWEDGVRTVFERGERLAVDFRFPAEGGARWYSARLLPEPGPGGAVEHVISAFTDITDRVNQEAEQAALRRVATVVAREGDLEEIGRVVAEEATLLLGATGSAVYRFESAEHGHLRRRPPAGRRGRRSSPPRCRSAAPPRPAARRGPASPPGSTTTPTLPRDPRGGPGARGRAAQRHRGAAVGRRAASGARSRRARPSRARSGPPTSGAWPPSPSWRPSPSPTPRPAPSWPASPRPTRSPGSPTGAPSRSALNGEVERARRHGHLLTLVDPRPRRLQGHQRHPRPPGGRPRCWPRWGATWRRPRGPASSSRGSAARSSPGSSPRLTRRGRWRRSSARGPASRASASTA